MRENRIINFESVRLKKYLLPSTYFKAKITEQYRLKFGERFHILFRWSKLSVRRKVGLKFGLFREVRQVRGSGMEKNVRLEMVRSSGFGVFGRTMFENSGFLEDFSRFEVWQLILGKSSGSSKFGELEVRIFKFNPTRCSFFRSDSEPVSYLLSWARSCSIGNSNFTT